MMRACSMFMKRLLILLLDNKVTLFVQVLLHHFPGPGTSVVPLLRLATPADFLFSINVSKSS